MVAVADVDLLFESARLFLLRNRLKALGGYLREGFDRRALLNATEPSGAGDSGYLEATVRQGGLAASWRATERLFVGGRLTFTHLRLEAKLDHQDSGTEDLAVGMAAGSTRVTGDGGLLFLVSPGVSVGAAYRQGATWTADRTAVNPSIGTTLDTTPCFSASRVPSPGGYR
jgi:hypothetical protein